MAERRLPIGVPTFREIREQNCYCVDKTASVGRLLDRGKHVFLSRPRPFGKSLFLDTHITLDAAYSSICGYTDAALDRVFAPELPGLVEMEPEVAALAQLQTRRYADKYRDGGEPIPPVRGGVQPGIAQRDGVRGG